MSSDKQWSAVRSDTRMAGEVIRYHTWPTLRKQTIANHSWNVLRIVLTVWKHWVIAPGVVEYITLHDVGEIRTGDAPYPIKRDNPQLKSIMDKLEDESLMEQGIKLQSIDDMWKWRIKVAHTIEMMEFGLDELLLGSSYAGPVVTRMKIWLNEQLDQRPPGVTTAEVDRVVEYTDERLKRTASVLGYHGEAVSHVHRGFRRPLPPVAPLRPGTPEDGGQHAQDDAL